MSHETQFLRLIGCVGNVASNSGTFASHRFHLRLNMVHCQINDD